MCPHPAQHAHPPSAHQPHSARLRSAVVVPRRSLLASRLARPRPTFRARTAAQRPCFHGRNPASSPTRARPAAIRPSAAPVATGQPSQRRLGRSDTGDRVRGKCPSRQQPRIQHQPGQPRPSSAPTDSAPAEADTCLLYTQAPTDPAPTAGTWQRNRARAVQPGSDTSPVQTPTAATGPAGTARLTTTWTTPDAQPCLARRLAFVGLDTVVAGRVQDGTPETAWWGFRTRGHGGSRGRPPGRGPVPRACGTGDARAS